MNETEKVNIHEGHEATCLCCNLLHLIDEAGWSEWTPPFFHASCEKKHFNTEDSGEGKSLFRRGKTCPDFDPMPNDWCDKR